MSLKNPRIFVLVSNDLYTDQRVDKMCLFLGAKDFDVLLLGRRRKNSIQLTPRKYRTKRFNLLFEKGPLFYASLNIRFFLFLLFHRCDWILANDLDTLPAAFFAKRLKKNCQLAYDSHEFFTGVPELVARPQIQKIWCKIERYIFPKLEKIYTVNQSIADMYFDLYGKRPLVVRNVSPRLDLTSLVEISLPANQPPILIFQGAGINVERGAEEAVLAMQYISEAQLFFIGDGDVLPKLKNMVNQLGLQEKVRFFGRMPYLEMMAYTHKAFLGLSLDKPGSLNYENSLPNKLFDYIHAGTPIVASNLREVNQLVTKNNVGEIIEQVDPKLIAEKVNHLLVDRNKWSYYRDNCLSFAEKCNWEQEVEKLNELYS